MDHRVLGFLLTDKCNFKCTHCCTESHPGASQFMATDDIYRCIDQAQESAEFHEVGISGGEPFLFPKDLLRITRYASEHGFPVSVTSNAFWAISESKAYQLLDSLRAAGLRGLNISISSFHLQFNRPDRLRNAAKAGHALGLVTRINCVVTRQFTLDKARELFDGLAEGLEFVEIPCIPTGRAASSVPSDELIVQPGIPLGSCKQHFTKLAVTMNGDAFPCCSPGGFTEPLKLGNIRHRRLDSIMEDMADNPLIRVLSACGPAFFAAFITRRLGSAALSAGFVDQCHLCHTIMSNVAMRAVVEEALTQLEQELAELLSDDPMLADLDAGHASMGKRRAPR